VTVFYRTTRFRNSLLCRAIVLVSCQQATAFFEFSNGKENSVFGISKAIREGGDAVLHRIPGGAVKDRVEVVRPSRGGSAAIAVAHLGHIPEEIPEKGKLLLLDAPTDKSVGGVAGPEVAYGHADTAQDTPLTKGAHCVQNLSFRGVEAGSDRREGAPFQREFLLQRFQDTPLKG
jgi:hypothetical protein